MKKGEIVTIYHDPLTRTKPEGQAELLTKVSENKNLKREFWEVRFLSDGIVCTRMVG